MSLRRAGLGSGLLAVALSIAGSAAALHEEPTVTIGREGATIWDMLDPTVADSTLTPEDANGVATWSLDTDFVKNAYTVSDWTIQLKEDPFVTNNVTLTNTSGMTSTFVVTVILPIPAFAYDTVINSSFGVTATDSDGNGTLLFAVDPSASNYTGFVNFGPSTTLLALDAPGAPITTADCPVSFPGCTATSSTGVASLGVAPGVANAIGISLTFQLSDQDSVALTSRFEIVNVPEPATLSLLGAGLLGAAALARRRSA